MSPILLNNNQNTAQNSILGLIQKTSKTFQKSFFALLLLLGISGGVWGQTAGFNNTFAIVSLNGGANAYYDLNATTANTDFNGANLGSFNPASNSLTLKGAEHNVYKCNGCDLTSTRLNYRIYSTTGTAGTFVQMNVPYTSTFANGCGGADQVWSATGNSVNVLSGLAPGTYYLEVYSDATVTCTGGTVYATNGGANYKATFTVSSYVTTNSGSGLAATYSTLAAAITALNAATITSPVVITLYGNETAPTGGYSITKSGTATNTITIQGNGAANTIVTAFGGQVSGVKTDAVFKIIGADYITLQNMRIQENSANTTTVAATNNMTEFGVGLFLTSATDGAQNNKIENNTISLGSTYQNAIGIYSSSAHSSTNATLVASATSGTNFNNKIYGNTINNVAYGIYVLSPANTSTIIENGWDIGGISSATGNTITFGNAILADIATTSFSAVLPSGITIRNATTGQNVRFNSITSNSLSYAQSGGLGGIVCTNGTNPLGITHTNTFSNNTITLTNTGTTAITGIDFGAGLSTGTIVSSNNNITINRNATAATSAAVIGIKANYASATNTCSSNTVVFNQSNTTGALSSATTGITLSGAGTTLTANSNSVTINQTGSGTATITGALIGIDYSAAATTINSLSNTIIVNQTTSVASGITNTITGIKATSAATTLNIGSVGNGNTITLKQEITGSGTYGAGAVTYINAASGSATLNIVSNTINNTSSQHRATGTCYAISHNSTITSALTVNNNTINLNFGATGPASLSGIYSFSSTALITTYNITNNSVTLTNTVAGSTVHGILNSDGGTTANKVCTGNTFAISGAAVSTNGMTVGYSNAYTISGNTFNLTSSSTSATQLVGINLTTSASGAHSVTNNTFTNINLSGVLTTSPIVSAIYLLVGNGAAIFGNTISNITIGAAGSTGSPSISGVSIAGGTLVSVYKNKIYGISSLCTGATGVVNGILIFGGTTNNVYNNLIGNLTASASTSTDAIRGISITSTTASSTNKVYNNTVYLTGSGGTNFGSSGIYHTANATTTTAALDLQNNMIFNTCTPSGTGIVTAYRRSSGVASMLANYASASNKNLFYAGTPGASNLIYSDGASSAQTMAAYQAGAFTAGTVATRDANSFTESSFTPSTYFVSTTGSNANYLQPASGLNTQAEGGGNTIAMCSPDYNGVTRPGFSGAAYDVGAWEFAGVSPAPVLTNMTSSPALTTQCTTVARAISIDVTTASGTITGATLNYNHNGTAQTAITMTNSSGNTWTGTMLAPSTGNATVTWSITAINSLGLSTLYNGTSYADEPTTGITATATATPSTVCAGSNASLSVSLAKSGTGVIGSGVVSSSSSPTPFSGSYGGMKGQYIILASELISTGYSSGNITGLGINFASTVTVTYTDLTIQIGNTSLNAFNSTLNLQSGLTTVYGPTSLVNPVAGVNAFTLTTPFNWDGVSNIIISTSWSNNTTTSTSASVITTTTTSNLAQVHKRDSYLPASLLALTGAQSAGSSTVGTARPNFTIIGNQSPTPSAYSWSNGSSVVGNTNPLSTPIASGLTYTATATVNGCPMTAAVTPTVLPLPTAPTASNSSQCGAGIPTASVADNNGYTTPTFKWYSAASGGAALQSSTSTTYTTSISATTTFYVAVVGTNTCESARTAVTVSVTQPDAISAVTSAAAICLGQSVTLTAANTATTPTQSYSYSWACTTTGSGATSANTNNPASVTPTAAGSYTYTVTGTSGSCSAVNTVAVTVNALPNITSATATPATVCSGALITLTGANSTLINYVSSRTAPTNIANTTPSSYGLVFDVTTAFKLNSVDVFNGTTSSGTFVIQLQNSGGTVLQTSSTLTAPAGTGVIGTTVAYTANLGWDIPVGTGYRLLVTSGTASLIRESSLGGFPYTIGSVGSITSGYISGISTTYYYLYNWQVSTGSDQTSSYSWAWNTTPAIATATGSTTETNTGASATTKTYTVTATNATTGCTNTATTSAVTINPATVAPTATNSSQCGTATPTCSVTGTGTSGNTFKWYLAATGGTALSGQTASTLSSYPVAATTSFYVSENNGTCESARVQVDVTVSTPPSITASATLSTVCSGSPTVLSATSANSGYTYSWDNSLGAGASVTANPTSNTTYTVTATDNSGGANNGCATSATVAITTNALPSAITFSPASATICTGSTQSIIASGGNGATTTTSTLFNEDFNSGLSSWTVTNSGASPSVSNWVAQTAPLTDASGSATFSNFSTSNGGKFAYSNPDAGGSGTTTNTVLQSPAFNTLGAASATLTFEHVYRKWSSGDQTAALEISIDNGATWTVLKDYKTLGSQGTTTNSAQVTTNESITLANTYLNQASVKIRFNYVSAWGYFWLIDNIVVTGSSNNISWSPTATLFTDAAATIAYTGNPTTVYAKPTSTTTYTATATTAAGCTSSNTATVTVTPTNTASAASSSPTLCINTALTAITHTTTGATGIGTATGLPAGVTAAWASNTITISGTPSASGTFSYSIPLSGGCGSVNATGTITVNALPTVTATASQSICPGSSVTLSGGGASTYSWNNGITNGVAFTPSATATYTVTGTDANGCVNTANSTVTLYTLPTVTATASQSICPGSSVTLSGGGANTYSWNNGITNGVAFTPSATTTYTVTGTDANGCVSTANSTVTLYALPTWGNLQWPPSGTICAGGTFDIYGQVYENGVTNASYTAPGAGVVAQFGYSASNSNPNTWTTWSNATYNSGVGNNDEFKGTLSGLSAGTYYYAFRYALNNGTCYVYGAYSGSGGGFWNGTTNVSGVLTVNALPTISGTANVCLGSSTALTGSGTAASSNAWSSSNTGVGTINSTTTTGTLSSVAAGTTNVTYTDNNGCVSTATTVTVNALPTVTATASAASLCAGSNLTLTGGGASTYTWDNGATNALAFAASTSTNYTVTGTNANGCVNTASTSVTVLASPTANAGADITGASTCGKNTVTVNATALNNNESGAWTVITLGTGATLPGSFSAVTTPTDDFTGSYGGTYTLAWTVTNTSTNCTNTDNMVVTFNQPITTSLGSSIGNADFLWNGLTSVDWSTGGNWFRNVSGEYQLQTGTIEPTNTNQVFTLTSAQGGVCIGSNMPTIGNGDNALDVFVGSGITLNLASGSLNLSGNLVNNGTINAAQGTINFIGSTNATVSGSGTTTLNNVTINKSSSANLTLSTNVAVNGVLNMLQGNVFTASSPNGLLTLGSSSAVPGTLTWTSGNIVGPFRRFFTTAATQGNEGLFPVGTATYQRYAKVNFTASPGSNQTLTAWYIAGTPMSANAALYNGLPLTTQDGQLIQNYSADGYWQIDPTDNNYTAPINSANYSIDLYANNLTGMQDPTICRIIKAAGSNTSSSNHVQWQGCGTHTTIPTGTSASAFVINSTVASGFSWFGAGTSNNQALPVELTSFSGNCADGKVDLEWSTATEHNSAYFQVEYSRDGSVWQNIGVVAAAGNSVQNINYTLTHEQVASGNNYYRLRQVDIDGVEELYDAIAVTCTAGSDQYIMTYPNPSEQNFQVALLDENLIGTATLSMVDARGMLIHSELLEVKAGTNLFLFNNTGLAPGIYYVKISKGAYSSEVVKQVVR